MTDSAADNPTFRNRGSTAAMWLAVLASGCSTDFVPTDTTAPCNGSYTDVDFGINFAPPSGLDGPRVQDSGAFRLVAWEPPATATPAIVASLSYSILPLEVDVNSAVESVLAIQREVLVEEAGQTLLTDEPTTLAGGNQAHVLTGASADGLSASVVVVAAGTERFALVILFGAESALETMLTSALSVCVE